MISLAKVAKFSFTEMQAYISNASNYARVFMKPHTVTVQRNENGYTQGWHSFGVSSGFRMMNGMRMAGECTIYHLDSLHYTTHVAYAFNNCKFPGVNSVSDLMTNIPSEVNQIAISAKGEWVNTKLPFWVLIFPNKFKKPLFSDYTLNEGILYGAIICDDIYGSPNFATARIIRFSQLISVFDCRAISKYTAEVKAAANYKEVVEDEPKLKTVVTYDNTAKTYAQTFASTENPVALLLSFVDNIKNKNYDYKFLTYGLNFIANSWIGNSYFNDELLIYRYSFVLDLKPTADSFGCIKVTNVISERGIYRYDKDAVAISIPITSKQDLKDIILHMAVFQSYDTSESKTYDVALFKTAGLFTCFTSIRNADYYIYIRDWMSRYVKLANKRVANMTKTYNDTINYFRNDSVNLMGCLSSANVNINNKPVNDVASYIDYARNAATTKYTVTSNDATSKFRSFIMKTIFRVTIAPLNGYKKGCELRAFILKDKSEYVVVRAVIPDIFKPFADIYFGDIKWDNILTEFYDVSFYDELVANNSNLLKEPHPYLPFLDEYNIPWFASTPYMVLRSVMCYLTGSGYYSCRAILPKRDVDIMIAQIADYSNFARSTKKFLKG